MVVLRLARDNNVPVDVSVASGLLLDELVSFCFAVVFCTHMAPRRWADSMVILRLARVHKDRANASTVQEHSPDETVSFCFAIVFCTQIAPRRLGPIPRSSWALQASTRCLATLRQCRTRARTKR